MIGYLKNRLTYGSIISMNIGINIFNDTEVFAMNVQKLSVSLPQPLYEFIKIYQAEHHYKTQSEVIKKALFSLRQAELEICYREANQEIDPAFEGTNLDGIEENETW